MKLLRKILAQAFVWLTAVSTLLAGTPHVQCRCPSGIVKPVCFAPVGIEPCCCGQKPAPTRSPCCAQPAKTTQDDESQPACKPPGCQKTVVPSSPATLQRADLQDHVAAGSETVPETYPTAQANGLVVATLLEIWLPPPVDRHLVLQHFVI